MGSTTYNTSEAVAGDVKPLVVTAAIDTYHKGMPLAYEGEASSEAGGSDTGNGTLAIVSVSKDTPQGNHVITFSGALAADYEGPNGMRESITLTDGASKQYNINGIVFTITDGSAAFVSTDSFTISVEDAGAYEYNASKPEVIVYEDKTLAAEGKLMCLVSGSEFLSAAVVDDSGNALTVTNDIKASLLSNGIILR